MSMTYLDKCKEWLESTEIDEETKEELRKIEGNNDEIQDRFYKNL